ncbi:hypothetical protein ALC57_14398 [Trachymyrmex cornetzi]|uniref:Uncharacterized protein n=1 Tax=Trachymyrmex cornetzi TaxID=471704 RepID=A0A195DKH9_9HYME|nr:hypothetical protein ALC57_14398 [Trachymyrmex cornetzi]
MSRGSELRTPGGYCGRQGARGMYEPVVRVREERGWKRDEGRRGGEGGQRHPLMLAHGEDDKVSQGMSKPVEIFGKRLYSGSRTNNNLNHVALSAVIQSKFNGERIAIADKPYIHVELIIIVLGQLNQSMAYRSRRYFVWKLGPTGTCANKVLGDDDSAILRQPLLVTLTFLITGSRCRRASSTLCVLASLDDLTGIEKHGRNERVVELT